jgi:hypothetical protein
MLRAPSAARRLTAIRIIPSREGRVFSEYSIIYCSSRVYTRRHGRLDAPPALHGMGADEANGEMRAA